MRKWYLLYSHSRDKGIKWSKFSRWALIKFDSVLHRGNPLICIHFMRATKRNFVRNKNAREKEIGPQFSVPLSSFISRLAEYRCQRGRHWKRNTTPPLLPFKKSYYGVMFKMETNIYIHGWRHSFHLEMLQEKEAR